MKTQNDSDRATALLPAGYHCAVTWSIPEDFGGMTNALFHRSRAFVREGHVSVDVLTFGFEPELDDIRWELEADGVLIPGVALRNMWEELARFDDTQLALAGVPGKVHPDFIPLAASDGYEEKIADTGGSTRTRVDSAGKTLQTDYLRADGSVLVSDRLDSVSRGTIGGRRVTLCDRAGEPLVTWNQIWPLYLFWLDSVIGGRETYMIIDSKFTANFLTRFRRPNVVTLHQLHSAHVANPPHGEMHPSRRYTFDRLHLFDSVVFLTERQRNDVELVFDPPGNTAVVPNSRSILPAHDGLLDQPRSGGVVLARFTKAKRLDHAIKAVDLATKQIGVRSTLRIFGGGSQAQALTHLISESGLEDVVSLNGFEANASRHFKSSSFTLLTSRSEGLPLVLLEAMSVGCIPVAYDIAYGPADIITDGVDGFLVRDGDIEAVAEKISLLEQMKSTDLNKMRIKAMLRASDFGDAPVVKQWGRTMEEAADRKVLSEIQQSL